MFSFLHRQKRIDEVISSSLYDERSFYPAFIADLRRAEDEIIIESPFITPYRMEKLFPVFALLLKRDVKIHIITRDPTEHDEMYCYQSTDEILKCAEIGIHVVMLKGNHHRKLAVIDKNILWEGSLNILSHVKSREIMRRIVGAESVKEMTDFLSLDKVV